MGVPYVVILTVPILKGRVWGSGGSGLVVSLLCALGGEGGEVWWEVWCQGDGGGDC